MTGKTCEWVVLRPKPLFKIGQKVRIRPRNEWSDFGRSLISNGLIKSYDIPDVVTISTIRYRYEQYWVVEIKEDPNVYDWCEKSFTYEYSREEKKVFHWIKKKCKKKCKVCNIETCKMVEAVNKIGE